MAQITPENKSLIVTEGFKKKQKKNSKNNEIMAALHQLKQEQLEFMKEVNDKISHPRQKQQTDGFFSGILKA